MLVEEGLDPVRRGGCGRGELVERRGGGLGAGRRGGERAAVVVDRPGDRRQAPGDGLVGDGVGPCGGEGGRGVDDRGAQLAGIRTIEPGDHGAHAGAQRLDLGLDGSLLGLGGLEAALGLGDVVGQHGVGDGGRQRVLERTADRARGARGERARQLARHAVEPSLAQVEQLGAAVERG